MHESLCRHRDHGARHSLIGIDDLAHGGRVVVNDRGVIDDVGGVVDVGYDGRRDHRVAAVDLVEITAAHRIRGLIDLARR